MSLRIVFRWLNTSTVAPQMSELTFMRSIIMRGAEIPPIRTVSLE
jgi:hypothetical protein